MPPDRPESVQHVLDKYLVKRCQVLADGVDVSATAAAAAAACEVALYHSLPQVPMPNIDCQ